jgi:TRAP-type C4-dicarboxylate transport system permease large subunit
VVKAAGIDLIHFGILVVFGVGIGQQTPPVGSTLFVASAIARVGILEITKHNIPFILCLLFIMLVILFVPDVALLLPKLLK